MCKGDFKGLKKLKLEDQMGCIDKKFRKGCIRNNVKVCRKQQQLEKVRIPERYTNSVGVRNECDNNLSKSKTAEGAIKTKTFTIEGEIKIKEKVEGFAKEKNFKAHDNVGKEWSQNVVIVGDHCESDSCSCSEWDSCKSDSDSDSDKCKCKKPCEKSDSSDSDSCSCKDKPPCINDIAKDYLKKRLGKD